MSRHTIPLLLALSLASQLSAAQPTTFELGAVIVTADANEPTVDSISQSIDAATIRKFERTDIADALRLVPGVTVNNNGPRNESGIYLRGFDLRQVPVYIDGIPVYVPYDGYVDLRRFSTADVSEIRVAKGFSSVLYGPNTLGGAINILSRKPERPIEGDLMAGWFQEDGYQTALNIGSRVGDWYFQASASFLDADSYRLSKDFEPTAVEDGGKRENAYRRDWRVSAKIGYTPNETDEYAVGYVLQRGEKGNPPYTGTDPLMRTRYWQWPRWDKQTIYFMSHTQLGENFYIKPRLYFDQFKNTLSAYDNATYSTQNLGSSFTSIYDDYTFGGSIEMGAKLGENNTLKAIIHGKFDHHEEYNVGEPLHTFEDTIWSIGLEDTHQFTKEFSVVAGISYDWREVLQAVDTNSNQALGGDTFDAFNPQIGLFYKLPEIGDFHLTVARKSRFPTIKDRYSYRLGQAIPNPDLEPETAMHYEIGYEGEVVKGLTFRSNLFMADISDTIQRVDNVLPGRFQLQNVGKSRHLGAEVGFDYLINPQIQIGGSYTYLDRQNRSQPDIRLIDTPRNSVFAYAEVKPWKALSIIPSLEYNSERYSTSYGVEASSYVVTNLKLELRLPKNVTLSVGANNLFDRNYELTEGFPEQGRTLFVNLRTEW